MLEFHQASYFMKQKQIISGTNTHEEVVVHKVICMHLCGTVNVPTLPTYGVVSFNIQ